MIAAMMKLRKVKQLVWWHSWTWERLSVLGQPPARSSNSSVLENFQSVDKGGKQRPVLSKGRQKFEKKTQDAQVFNR
jgi:hypothetical protein